MSIARELQLSGDLHNPFWPVFLPHSMVLNRPDIQKEQHLIEQAANLREVIRAARSIEFQHAYMEEHKKMAKRPLFARNPNPDCPRYVMSSSSPLRFYDLRFQKLRPQYVETGVTTIDIFEALRLNARCVVTSWDDGQRGYYIHGHCHNALWREIERSVT